MEFELNFRSIYFKSFQELDDFMNNSDEEEILRMSSGLPCQGQVLRYLVHIRFRRHTPIRVSANQAVRACSQIWSKFGIPTCDHLEAVARLERMYKQWWELRKFSKLDDDPVKLRLKMDWFLERMGYLFDISARNALDTIEDERVKTYLRFMFDVDHSKLLDYLF